MLAKGRSGRRLVPQARRRRLPWRHLTRLHTSFLQKKTPAERRAANPRGRRQRGRSMVPLLVPLLNRRHFQTRWITSLHFPPYRSTHGRDERWFRGETVNLGCHGQHDHVLNTRSDRRRWYTGFLQDDYNETILCMNDADKSQLHGHPVGFLPWLFTTVISEYCLQAEM